MINGSYFLVNNAQKGSSHRNFFLRVLRRLAEQKGWTGEAKATKGRRQGSKREGGGSGIQGGYSWIRPQKGGKG